MKHLHGVLLLAALALAGFAGCAVDDSSNPTSPGSTGLRYAAPVTDAIIGPSEIVLALDVSDSIGSDELSMEIMGLKACLQNTALFPADGSVAVAMLVYGDTTAAPVSQFTAVTPQNYSDIFEPVLDSLMVDRLVPTTGADLTGVLNLAGSIIATGSASDQQVLLAGSGAAKDDVTARLACLALEEQGVMISALGMGADDGMDLFKDCSRTGYFEAVAEGDIFPCERAFSFMLLVDLIAQPETAQLAPGEEHVVSAKVLRGNEDQAFPIGGLEVSFAVASGPNAGLSASASTDSMGMAEFRYTGDGGAGMDTIVVSAMHPGTQVAMTDTVTVSWLNTPPVCDAGGPYAAEVMGDTVLVQLDGSGSSDADGDTLSYQWFVDSEDASFDDATAMNPVLTLTGASLCADSILVKVQVSDGADSSSCTSVVTLTDKRPPVLVAADPYMLWPPNHKLHAITPEMLIETAEDACGDPIDLSGVEIVEVRSSEAVNDKGDGNTEPDIFIACPNGLHLRAERAGGGDSRVYTVIYRITDDAGNVTELETHVVVPHDQGKGGGYDLDAPAAYAVSGDCGDVEPR